MTTSTTTSSFSDIAKRRLPVRGPPGWLLVLGVLAGTGWGVWRLQKRTFILRELERESRQTKFILEPLIKGEQDRQVLHTRYQLLRDQQDASIFQFYHNDRYYDSAVPLF